MAEVLHILAWPVVVIVAVVVLRKPLGDLILSVRTLRYKQIEVEFGEGIKKAEQDAEKLLPKDAGVAGGSGGGSGSGGGAAGKSAAARTIEITLRDLAASSPATAVVEAWRGVEACSRDALAARGISIDGDHPTPYKEIQNLLAQHNILDGPRGDLFNELRLLRNKVKHAPAFAISTEQAMQYVELAAMLCGYLQK